MLGSYIELAQLGVIPLFGFSSIITSVDSRSCGAYFANYDLDRCLDNGYLQYIRLLGAVNLFVLPAAILSSFDAYTDNSLGLSYGLGEFQSGTAEGQDQPKVEDSSNYQDNGNVHA